MKVRYPADFMFVASMNPCHVEIFGSDVECRCTTNQISRYLSKISGPLLDRIDLHVEMGKVRYDQIQDHRNFRNLQETVRGRVNSARDRQVRRYQDVGKYCNAQRFPSAQLGEYCAVDNDTRALLKALLKN